jgi:formate-dependent nitrite reductase cytochrome c552 subunit
MEGTIIRVKPEDEDHMEQLTDEEGAAFFSFDQGGGQKYYIEVIKEYYDTVYLSKYTHSHDDTEIIYIKMYPQVRLWSIRADKICLCIFCFNFRNMSC